MTLRKSFYLASCLCFAAWMSATPALSADSCKGWNTVGFFTFTVAADVSRCLRAGAEVNTRGRYGYTPLHRAAAYNKNPAVINALVKAGAKINARDERGGTPLHSAAFRNKNPAIITALVKAGGYVNARYRSSARPLHFAALHTKNPAVITALLKAGAKVKARNTHKATPLHYAARNKNPAVITTLVKAGGDVNARDDLRTTPLHWAVMHNQNPVVITVLLAAGADPNALDKKGRTPLKIAQKKNNPSFVTAFSQQAVTAFKQDERKAAAAARKRRLERRLRPSLVSCRKWNTSSFFRHARAEDVSRCLGAGADLNAQNKKGRTPLHTAAYFSKTPAVVKALIKAGADLKARDKKDRTPLQFAEIFSKSPDVVAALKQVRAKPGARPSGAKRVSCEKWNTPAFFRRAGLADLTRCLKVKDPNTRNNNGRTPLHYAAQGETPAFVSDLVKAGAKVNARDERGGWTPLHLAAWFGKTPAVVAALLSAGADPAAKDKKGKTPWDYAEQNAALKDTAPYWRLKKERFR